MTCRSILKQGSKIAIIGEAPGEVEDRTGIPFQGSAGVELKKMLSEAGLSFSDCSVLNVFEERPPKNNVLAFCKTKKEMPKGYNTPFLQKGKYVCPEHLPHVERLHKELEELKPNLILALGNTACWALLGSVGITKLRGTICASQWGKVLPTFHPAAVLRQWEYRPIVLFDLLKAKREMEYPEIRLPKRSIWINPTLVDLEDFKPHLVNADIIAFDIETRGKEISCISFAPSPDLAIVVPFQDKRKPGWSYWETKEEERKAWDFVRWVLSLPCKKLAHNGNYDIQWLWKQMGFALRGEYEDTMLLHHSLYPELQKSLGFLGSIYTNEAAWKLLRVSAKETTKGEDE